jgi:beta-glucosidase
MESKPFRDSTLSVHQRVDLLMPQMTVKEKVAQLWGVWATDLLDSSRQFQQKKAQSVIPDGVGQISRLGALAMLPPQQTAPVANAIQKFLVEQTRLGIPAVIHEESCAGYLARGATTFPQAIGMAATWEPELVEKMADVIRQQMRAVGAHHTLAPVLDVARDPRWGRLEETFGEDPFLITNLGTAYINGIQGTDWRQGIIATAKHFLGHGWSEGGLNWAPVHIPERELREVFLTPFAAAIKEANIGSVMNAYHEMDGIPCGSSREFLVDLLRNELGFDGVVVADYFTVNMLVEYHHLTDDKSEAARLALEAGIDVELPAVDCYGQPLLDAIETGRVDMSLVDACVRRILRQKIQFGLFENPFVDTGKVTEVYSTSVSRELSRQLAQKSIVLLKNKDNLLPLRDSLESVAVIGPCADSIRLLQGDYHYPSHLEGILHASENMETPSPHIRDVMADWDDQFPESTTVLDGVRARVSPQTSVNYAKGCDILGDDRTGFDEAISIARAADVAIVVVGDKSGLGIGCTTGEAIDRATLNLPGVQQPLVEAIHATGTPTVVVLLNGRPYALPRIKQNIPAILEAWLPAQEGGKAVADVLFGDVNPGGKLPVSFPQDVGQIPVYYNHKPSGGRSHWYGQYMDMGTDPLFPFGHGLSYTQFEYSDLLITPQAVGPGDEVVIQVKIKNVGAVSGDEVVQLYVRDPVASVTRPVKELKGFKRLTLHSAEQKTVAFQMDVRHLAFYNRQMDYVVEPGKIEVMVGSSSQDIRLHGSFEITGEAVGVEQVFFTRVVISD